MTLIISAKAKSHVVITADGRCSKITDGIYKKTSDNLQKIFPLSNRGFAIAHHGENIINGRKIGDIIERFYGERLSFACIKQITHAFVEKYDSDIRETLIAVSDRKACGFLFVGFGKEMNRPQIWEAFWEKQKDNTIVCTIKEHGDLVLSGDAKEYIIKYIDEPVDSYFNWKNINFFNDYKFTIEFCNKLYQIAEDTQTTAIENIFGGHKHQLLIKKTNCEWLVPPLI